MKRSYPLDLDRVILMGHSSGAQLALWLAARGRTPQSSALYTAQPLKVAGVIGLAAITDLKSYREGPPGSCHAAVDQLLGGSPETVMNRYDETSPRELVPLRISQWFIQGSQDTVVSLEAVRLYTHAAEAKGDSVHITVIPGAGHFDVVVPQNASWSAIQNAVKSLMK